VCPFAKTRERNGPSTDCALTNRPVSSTAASSTETGNVEESPAVPLTVLGHAVLAEHALTGHGYGELDTGNNAHDRMTTAMQAARSRLRASLEPSESGVVAERGLHFLSRLAAQPSLGER